MSLDMYAEEILDHYRNPKNFGEMKNPDYEYEELNPICGDKYKFQIKVENNIIKSVKFNGDGCAISMASCSILSEFIKEMELSKIKKIQIDELLKLLKINVSLARMKCVTLSLNIIKKLNINNDL